MVTQLGARGGGMADVGPRTGHGRGMCTDGLLIVCVAALHLPTSLPVMQGAAQGARHAGELPGEGAAAAGGPQPLGAAGGGDAHAGHLRPGAGSGGGVPHARPAAVPRAAQPHHGRLCARCAATRHRLWRHDLSGLSGTEAPPAQSRVDIWPLDWPLVSLLALPDPACPPAGAAPPLQTTT